ncbi:MAG: type II toxin-antitoxin system PemK/MazF family toxin [Bacteroidales bacterium]|nr:type II toxin-antitoxin system PemK/MazF family toxin [Bacteroidales bacterium]
MKVSQGDIAEVNFLLPDGIFKPHPVVVLSNNSVNEYEDAFIGVMLSSTTTDDEFSFHLDNEMMSKPSKKQCQVRCQLLSLIPENQVIAKHGFLRKKHLKDLIAKINDCVFNIE